MCSATVVKAIFIKFVCSMKLRVRCHRAGASERKLDLSPSLCYSVTSSYIVSQDVDLIVSYGLIELSLINQ